MALSGASGPAPRLVRLVARLEVLTGVFMVIDVAAGFLFAGGAAALVEKSPEIAMGALALFAGISLLRAGRLAWGSSIALQLLLLPDFMLGAIHYRPGLGLFVSLGVDLSAANRMAALHEFTLGVDFAVSANASASPYAAINLAALACLVVLLSNRPAARGFQRYAAA